MVICLLSEIPTDFKKFARSHKPIKVNADADGIKTLLELPAKLFVIEPTGAYSRLWVTKLKEAGKEIRLVNSARVKFTLRVAGITNKNDRIDSAGIALFGLMYKDRPGEFLSPGLQKIREAIAARDAIAKSSRSLKNRIGSRLAYEWPEGCEPWKETKRKWQENPKPIVKAIAEIEIDNRWVKKRIDSINDSIGEGLNSVTIEITQQLHTAQASCQQLEKEISLLLAESYLEPYNKALDHFLAGESLRAHLIPNIYPFSRFLDGDKRIIEYIDGKKGKRSKRDRSESAFKLSCGMGRVQIQSGGMEKWVAGGDAKCRTAIWQYVKTQIVMGRGKNSPIPQLIRRNHSGQDFPWLNPKLIDAVAQAMQTTPQVASLRIHYEACNRPAFKREMSTASRFIRMLYKTFLKEFMGN